MALATTCPQCKTSFKVVPDQLKLRRGLVRCGVCQHVFSGIDYLRYVDDAARAAQRAARERAAAGVAPASAPGGAAPRAEAASGVRSDASQAALPAALAASAAPAVTPAPDEPPVSATAPAPAATDAAAAPGASDARLAASPASGLAASPPRGEPAPAPRDEPASFSFVLPDIDSAGDGARVESPRPGVADPPAGDTPDRPPASADAWAAPAPASAPVAPRAAGGLPALPAPDAPRVPLEELLSRPSAPWPPASGPQTIIDPDGDLKTAFFLGDSGFGPLPPEDAGEPAPVRAALPGLPLRPESTAAGGGPARLPVPQVPQVPQVPPARRAEAVPPEPAIDYFAGTRRGGRGLGLALSPVAWAAAIGLSALLSLQAVVGWRDAIAARVPLVAPTLAGLLGPFGLEVAPPRELDALTIEGFELQAAAAPNALSLSAVLRNRSGHVVGYPAMELALTDGTGALLVRKVIPADLYVGDATTIAGGLAARSERPIRLTLQHDGLQPTGYAVALFYP